MKWKIVVVYEKDDSVESETVNDAVYSKAKAKRKAARIRQERENVIQISIDDARPI